MPTVVEAWQPCCATPPTPESMCTFYYAIINEEVWFVPINGNHNGLFPCSKKQPGIDHSSVTVTTLRANTPQYYPVYIPGTLNLDTGEFHAS